MRPGKGGDVPAALKAGATEESAGSVIATFRRG